MTKVIEAFSTLELQEKLDAIEDNGNYKVTHTSLTVHHSSFCDVFYCVACYERVGSPPDPD
jgi:hypothetical protein